MKLIIRRDQDKGMLGGISFVMEARVELAPEEQELVKKYKAHREVLYRKGDRMYTIEDLQSGVRDKCKDVTVMLNNEQVYRDSCSQLNVLLTVMRSFGGEEVVEFDEASMRDQSVRPTELAGAPSGA